MNVKEEFQWIKQVLGSCETRNQVNSSMRLFKHFIKRWKYEIYNDELEEFILEYEKFEKDQICKIVSS